GTAFGFQDYVDRGAPGAPILNPTTAATQASSSWEQLDSVPEKTVWILDLDASGTDRPDSSYGLCVLMALAQNGFAMKIEQFLESGVFLSVILTLYPANLHNDDGVRGLVRPACDLTAL